MYIYMTSFTVSIYLFIAKCGTSSLGFAYRVIPLSSTSETLTGDLSNLSRGQKQKLSPRASGSAGKI